MNFSEFSLKKEILDAIEKKGFKEPSPIQKEAIPLILDGFDVVAQAQTGTGKTAAFGLPLINKIDCSKKEVQVLVIVPTRELAIQVSDELYQFGKYLGLNTATVYGGSSYQRQIKFINKSQIVVATPGRLIDLLNNNYIEISPKYVVLDEADEMLDMGFLDDIKKILNLVGKDAQKLLFSATMPKPILELSKQFLKNPKQVKIAKQDITNKNITQLYYVVDEFERDDALIRLFDYYDPKKSIVFCRTKLDVDRLSTYLISIGYSAKGLHGDMDQRQREEVIKAFKSNRLEILVATDVAARGLDVNDVDYVFNYQLPYNSEPYVHRIGRTARAGKEGVAVSIVTPSEFKALQKIQKDIKTLIEPKTVPTLNDLISKKQQKLIKKIEEQEILPEAIDLVEELKKEYDTSTIKYKLASILFNEIKFEGKNKIGKNYKDIKYLLAKLEEENKANRRNRGNRGYRRNRRRT